MSAPSPSCIHENLMGPKLDVMAFIFGGVLRNPSGMVSGSVPISSPPSQTVPASPSPMLLLLAASWHPMARGCWQQGSTPGAATGTSPQLCRQRQALRSPSSLGTKELQIPGLENPWAEVTPCESGRVSAALACRAGDEAGGEVSTTSPVAAAAQSSQEGCFP